MLLPVLSMRMAVPLRKSVSTNQKRPLAASLLCSAVWDRTEAARRPLTPTLKACIRTGCQQGQLRCEAKPKACLHTICQCDTAAAGSTHLHAMVQVVQALALLSCYPAELVAGHQAHLLVAQRGMRHQLLQRSVHLAARHITSRHSRAVRKPLQHVCAEGLCQLTRQRLPRCVCVCVVPGWFRLS